MILITAFKPFNDNPLNSTMEALKRASFKSDVVKAYLPVSFNETKDELLKLINGLKPDFIIMLGESGLIKEIAVEKRAKNLLDFRIEDNEGIKKTNEMIDASLPEFIDTSFKVDKLVSYLNAAKINSIVSLNAGSFICNYSYFLALKEAKNAVFIHLPYFIGESIDMKHKSIDILTLVRAIELSVKFVKENYHC